MGKCVSVSCRECAFRGQRDPLFSSPKRTSVAILLSWASSKMIHEYWLMSGSISASRSSRPSVMYLIFVSGPVQSSNRIEYPTSSPRRQPTSSATRLATDVAATRRGWVHPILPRSARPSSARYWVSWVVFPEPVSPMTMRTGFCMIRAVRVSGMIFVRGRRRKMDKPLGRPEQARFGTCRRGATFADPESTCS
jgi:hypothetical protein